ncbi:SMI1/KNR4 family protein [Thermomonospora catenispora]|uniref:SMI1/KNR4 family protein n=1 Tax=Thermomonospora catenispora TaxID=2493090 RepID=UPI00111DCCC2|nr:SMI1/KNR4 family protein [Thermomonospora catenispora]TNY36977.1 hypothetical protein EIO00_10470 [Thermomonospora catenispora]
MTALDDRVFEAIRARVDSGDYLDERLGPPGVDTDGGGAFQVAPDGRLQRVYWRGSPEYLAAHAAGLLEPLPPLTPAPESAVRECETLLGRPLPRLLRRCYLELGDGGFGPAYGIRGVTGEDNIIDAYREQQRSWLEEWRPMAERLLPVCDWGCGITSFIDIGDPDARMWAIDPNPAPADDYAVALFPQDLGFGEWMLRWVEGTLRQPLLVRDEITGEWRGATDLEQGVV